MFKRLSCLLILFCLLTGAALCEGGSLPIDFSPGMEWNPNGIRTDGYEDSTISVTITTGRKENIKADWPTGCDWFVADIVIKDPSQLRTMAAQNFNSYAVMDGPYLAKRANAVLAIEGDFYKSDERRGLGFIIRQGEMYLNNLDSSGSQRPMLMDVLLIDEDGNFHGFFRPEKGTLSDTVDGKRVINAFSFGPILVNDYKAVEDFNGADTFINMAADRRAQRMCICQVEPLHYKAICCASPKSGNCGMNVREFADFVATQGVRIAYNLDGGDSTMLILCGQKQNEIRNADTRKIMDIIYFASAEGAE